MQIKKSEIVWAKIEKEDVCQACITDQDFSELDGDGDAERAIVTLETFLDQSEHYDEVILWCDRCGKRISGETGEKMSDIKHATTYKEHNG